MDYFVRTSLNPDLICIMALISSLLTLFRLVVKDILTFPRIKDKENELELSKLLPWY